MLRKYQAEASDECVKYIKSTDTSYPIVIVPTGGGKSHIIADIIEKTKTRLLILQPDANVLAQNRSKFKGESSVFCDALKEKTISHVTFATIQSVNNAIELFKDFDIAIIDECHKMNPKDDGMYIKLFKAIGIKKVIGFTATPFRLETFRDLNVLNEIERANAQNRKIVLQNTGKKREQWIPLVPCPFDWEVNGIKIVMINQAKKKFFNKIIYCCQTQTLVEQGFLTPLRFFNYDYNTEKLKQKGTDYDDDSVEDSLEQNEVYDVVTSLVKRAVNKGFNSNIIFAKSVRSATKFKNSIENSEIITAKTKQKDREKFLQDFKDKKLHCLINVGTLTTGTDLPNIQNVFIARPLNSPILYSQIVGRGTRLITGHANYETSKEEKEFCNVIDLCGNFKKFGNPLQWEILQHKSGKWYVFDHTFKKILTSRRLNERR